MACRYDANVCQTAFFAGQEMLEASAVTRQKYLPSLARQMANVRLWLGDDNVQCARLEEMVAGSASY